MSGETKQKALDKLASVNLKSASLAAFGSLTFAILGLVVRQSLFARGPAAIAVQILAVILMVWARQTFGLRSFHAAANPTAGNLVTMGP